MRYPDVLQPTHTETFELTDRTVRVPKCILTFREWTGTPLSDRFGNKAVIDLEGRPFFAELAVRQLLANAGWEARWVETYGTRMPKCIDRWQDGSYREQQPTPFTDPAIMPLLERIACENGGRFAGCWDVVAKKDDTILFAETKRSDKDQIRHTQTHWLAAALRCGLNENNFLLVQWNFQTNLSNQH